MYLKKTILLLLSVLHVSVLGYAQQGCTDFFSGQIPNENNLPVIGASTLILPQQIGQAPTPSETSMPMISDATSFFPSSASFN
jgi:hypothetical protein